MSKPYCIFGDAKPIHAQGMCDSHYRRYLKGARGSELSAPISASEAPVGVEAPNTFDDKLRSILKQSRGKMTLELLSDRLDCGITRIKAALGRLQDAGVNVALDTHLGAVEVHRDIPRNVVEQRIDTSKFKGTEFKLGLTADNHLCSKYARNDVLKALFDIWAEQGITRVLQGGNMIDGEARFNRFDLLTRPGIDAQAEYLVNEWPQRPGIVTEFVCGDDHEGWYVQREGINIVNYLQHKADQAGRDDMKFLGYMETSYKLEAANGASRLSLIHAGGGSAYATSYSVQKIVESYQPNEKPSILLVGHFHKAEYSYPRAVHVVQAGCTQDQTPFLRKKRIEAMVGGWTIGFEVDSNGIIHKFKTEWHPFYDRSFYTRWNYKF